MSTYKYCLWKSAEEGEKKPTDPPPFHFAQISEIMKGLKRWRFISIMEGLCNTAATCLFLWANCPSHAGRTTEKLIIAETKETRPPSGVCCWATTIQHGSRLCDWGRERRKELLNRKGLRLFCLSFSLVRTRISYAKEKRESEERAFLGAPFNVFFFLPLRRCCVRQREKKKIGKGEKKWKSGFAMPFSIFSATV